jgi:hypothetical protein
MNSTYILTTIVICIFLFVIGKEIVSYKTKCGKRDDISDEDSSDEDSSDEDSSDEDSSDEDSSDGIKEKLNVVKVIKQSYIYPDHRMQSYNDLFKYLRVYDGDRSMERREIRQRRRRRRRRRRRNLLGPVGRLGKLDRKIM